jgi:hypothetical protein
MWSEPDGAEGEGLSKSLVTPRKKIFYINFFYFNIFLDSALNFQISEYLQNLF